MARVWPVSLLLIVLFSLLSCLQPTASESSTIKLLIGDFVKDVEPNKVVDLVLIVDRSTGLGEERFIMELSKLTGAVLRQYAVIHPVFTRSAVITFGGDSRVIFDFISNNRKTHTKCGVFGGDSPSPWDQVTYIRDGTAAEGTNMREAFSQANTIFSAGRQSRPSAKQIILLVTDGDYSSNEDPINSAKQLKNNQVTIFACGVGNWLKPGNVRILASQDGYYGTNANWTDMLTKNTLTSYSTGELL